MREEPSRRPFGGETGLEPVERQRSGKPATGGKAGKGRKKQKRREGMNGNWDRKRDFRDRTKNYASQTVRFYCTLPKGRTECQVLGKQLLRSGTSVAANYREASRARSDAEFVSKIDQCAQEADESSLWLELLRDDCHIQSDGLRWLLGESDELISIFVTMSKRVKERLN
jgi:four helix bundle protein